MDDEKEYSFLSGPLQEAFPLVKEIIGVEISSRGNKVFLQGEKAAIAKAGRIIEELRELNARGRILRNDEIMYSVRAVAEGSSGSLGEFLGNNILVSAKKKSIYPRTANQVRYVNAIKTHDMVFGIGPAGTGKTFLAMAMAINALINKQVSRVVLARPAVEAGERLGFLPGDLQEKVNPYLRPLYDALFYMMEFDKANRLIEQGIIEIAPLAFMRGRTLDDSFIILDEAQNTTSEQMKMYLTRLGFNSRTVITGDVTQIDLPPGKVSGLVEAREILGSIEGIEVVYFTEKDVVRHRLVQKIIKAYEKRKG